MADAQGRKTLYSGELVNKTYIYDAEGNHLETVDGDQTKNPLYTGGSLEPTGPRLKASPAQASRDMQLGKDMLTDMVGAASMAIPGGFLARSAVGVGTGTGVDQLLNPERPVSHSVGESVVNQIIAEVLPAMFFEKVRIGPSSRNLSEKLVSAGANKETSKRLTQVVDSDKAKEVLAAIDRLNNLDTSRHNKGALKQVEEAIKAREQEMYTLKRSKRDKAAESTFEKTAKLGDVSTTQAIDASSSGWLATVLEGLERLSRTRRTDPLDPMSKILAALGFNIGVDATVNAPRQ